MFRDLESEDNPALASILVFKAYGLMKENPYVLWKVLQEKLGHQWFVDVLIDRSKNHKYAIDYEPIEDILPTLNKLLIKHKPEKIDFLAGENGDFIKYVVETFQEQMAVCWKSVFDKENLVDQMHRETISFVHNEKRRFEGKSEEENEVKTSQDDALKDLEEAKNREIDMYKTKISLLMAEVKNLQSNNMANSHLNIMLEKRFNLILVTFKDVFQKIGTELDFNNFKNALEALRKVDAKTLQTLGVDKALAAKKMELLAKLVIQNTASRGTANKGTNTNTQTYTDLMYEDPELMGTLIAKIKQTYPGKIETRSGIDGRSGYEGSRYSKSNNRMGFMNSQASKFFVNVDKKKVSSNFNNQPKRHPDHISYRNDMSYYDGSVQESLEELRGERRGDHHSKEHQTARLGSELDGATSPRSKNHSIDSKLGYYKTQGHNPQITPTGRQLHHGDFSSRTIDDNIEFPNKFKVRAGQPRRSDAMSMVPNLTYTPEKGGQIDKLIEMSNTDKKKNRGDSAARKMSMFVSRDEVDYLRNSNMMHTSKFSKDKHNLSSSNEKVQKKSKDKKNKDPRTKHMDGNLNDFLTVSNIKEGIVLNNKDMPSVRLKVRQGDRGDEGSSENHHSKLETGVNSTNVDAKKRLETVKNVQTLQDLQSRRYFETTDNLSGELEMRESIDKKRERPNSKGKSKLFDLIEANRETPDSEIRLRLGQRDPKDQDKQEGNQIIERTRSNKKRRPVKLDLFLLDAIQIGLTQDLEMGLYLKIISNHQANFKLLGSRYKVVESLLKGPQNFLIYLSKRPGSRIIRQEERRLLEIIEQKTVEIERMKSKSEFTEV